jgi:hypothetical protein
MTFLPRHTIEFDPLEATVGVALRGHPFGLNAAHPPATAGGTDCVQAVSKARQLCSPEVA